MKSDTRTKRLLAINFGGLGDEVLFLPTLKSIKIEQPEWHVTLLTEPRGRSIADVTNVIDDNITFDIKKKPLKPADYLHLLGLLRNGKFDAVLSSGSSPMVAMLLFLSGIRKRIGYSSNRLAPILLTNPVPLNRNQHAARMYHDLAKGLGVRHTAERPEVFFDDANLRTMQDLLPQNNSKRVLLHPGTSKLAIEKGIIKNWDPKNWAALIQRLIENRLQVILAGGPDDDGTVSDIISHLGGMPEQQFVLAHGKTASLRDLVALMQLSDLLICVDSAPMHLGVGLDKPMVALFGPTDPAKLLWPSPKFIALRDPEAAARAGTEDPFLAAAKAKRTNQTTHSAASQPQQPYVQIPLDTVFQTALDLLKSIEVPGNSRGTHLP